MMSAAALTVFIIHKVAALRATIQGRATHRWTQLSDRFCNRLLIKGVRVRSNHEKGITNHAVKWTSPE